MQVTDITTQKNNPERCNVFVDGAYKFPASKECLVKNDIYIGKEFENDLIDKILTEDEYKTALDYAVKRLSYKPFSKKELIKVLEQKGYDTFTIEKVIEKLSEYKYLDDKELSRMIISDATNLRKLGKRAVYTKMMNKKIDNTTAKEALESYLPEDELQNALFVIEKYAKRYNFDGKDIKIKQKIYRALMTKGYSWDTIKEAFSKYNIEFYEDE